MSEGMIKRDPEVPSAQPYATYILILLCISVYCGTSYITLGEPISKNPSALILMGASNKTLIEQSGEWFRLATSIFLHHSFYHLAGNMALLFLAGRFLEQRIGGWWLWCIFAISGIACSLGTLKYHSSLPLSAGASGAILGLTAAAFISTFKFRTVWPKWLIRLLIIAELILDDVPYASLRLQDGLQVDSVGHIFGTIGGALSAVLLFLIMSTQELQRLRWPGRVVAVCLMLLFGLAFGLQAENLVRLKDLYWAETYRSREDNEKARQYYEFAIALDVTNAKGRLEK